MQAFTHRRKFSVYEEGEPSKSLAGQLRLCERHAVSNPVVEINDLLSDEVVPA